MLGRAIDKGKATAAGTNGEYNFDCPMDQAVFGFLNIKGDALLEAIKKSNSDSGHRRLHASRSSGAKSTEEIEQFNQQISRTPPERRVARAFSKICVTRWRPIAPTS